MSNPYAIDCDNKFTQEALRQYAREKDYIFSTDPLTFTFKNFRLRYVPAGDEVGTDFTIPFSLGNEFNDVEMNNAKFES